MNNLTWLLRAARWVRRPPGARRVRLVLGVVAVAAVLVTLEWLGLWPQWATLDHGRGPGRLPR